MRTWRRSRTEISKMMLVRISIVLGLSFFAATASAERVRTAIPRATVNYLSLPVAEVKGFFRSEGLDNETIVIPGTTAIAALVSGNVDYSGAGGSGMRAAVRGAPIKAIMFQTEKVTWYLLAASDIVRSLISRGNVSQWEPSVTPRTPRLQCL